MEADAGVDVGDNPNILESIAACAWTDVDAPAEDVPLADKSDGRRKAPCAIAAAVANGSCSSLKNKYYANTKA